MEDKICPLRMLQGLNRVMIGENHEELNPEFKCFGEKCAWFIKNDNPGSYQLAECAIMSLVSIQDLVR